MKEIETELEEYGLSNREAKVYVTLLGFGLATSESISKATGISRSTVYDNLNSLTNKGFVAFVIKDRVHFFEASDPTKLLQILQEKEEKIRKVLPELEKIKKSRIQKPTVSIYEGKEGLKTILADVLKASGEISIIGNHSNFIEYLMWSGETFTKTRVKRGISIKFIGEISKKSKELLVRDKQEKRQTKLFKDFNSIKSEIHLYGDKVALITLRENKPFGLIIEDKEINRLFRILFKRIWKA